MIKGATTFAWDGEFTGDVGGMEQVLCLDGG
jgi:hypothetical protein